MKRNHAPDVERTLYRPVEVAQRWGSTGQPSTGWPTTGG